MDRPRLFSTFMLWMLAQLYARLPEEGDLPKPKLAFFFDEAHLLFDDASDALMEQIELTARLIRSKGVGVYFVTQDPTDVPSSVLSQLGNRVQHALRVHTPEDESNLRKTVRTFPKSEHYDVGETLTSLGIGEALVTVLTPKGVPTPLAATRLVPPDSLMDAVDDATRAAADRGRVAADEVRRGGRPRERPRDDHRPPERRRRGRRGDRTRREPVPGLTLPPPPPGPREPRRPRPSRRRRPRRSHRVRAKASTKTKTRRTRQAGWLTT